MTEPMRIRHFELPSERDAEDRYITPFVIVFDRCPDTVPHLDDLGQHIKEVTGARGVLAFTQEVELG